MDEKNSTEGQKIAMQAMAAEANLAGLPPEQAFALGAMTGELILEAEARGYQRAVDALHNEADAAQLRSNDSYAEALESAANYLAERPQ